MIGKNENTMSEKAYLEMIISERIGFWVSQEKPEGEDPVSDRGEGIIRELPEEKRSQMEAYVRKLVEISAGHEKYIYLKGIEDGIRLMSRIEKMRES